jgi:uroporphyrinogen-III synthase
MHVLITRPEPDARAFKSRIEELGCRVSVAPLLNIAIETIPANAFDGFVALIATSRNGLKALAAAPCLDKARNLPIFVVGPATQAMARDMGFSTIIAGAGTAADLVEPISSHHPAQHGRIVHLSGDHQAFDLAGALQPHGIVVETLTVYRSVAAETLPDTVISDLKIRDLDAVILMSPRTASVWSSVLSELPFKPDLSGLVHICLSRAVADKLQAGQATPVQIAAQPNADEIVALVYRLAVAKKTG